MSTLVAEPTVRTGGPVALEGAERLQTLAGDAAEAIARDAFRYEAAPGTRRYAGDFWGPTSRFPTTGTPCWVIQS